MKFNFSFSAFKKTGIRHFLESGICFPSRLFFFRILGIRNLLESALHIFLKYFHIFFGIRTRLESGICFFLQAVESGIYFSQVDSFFSQFFLGIRNLLESGICFFLKSIIFLEFRISWNRTFLFFFELFFKYFFWNPDSIGIRNLFFLQADYFFLCFGIRNLLESGICFFSIRLFFGIRNFLASDIPIF